MKTASLLTAAAVALATAAPASAFTAVNRLDVTPLGNARFEVIEARGAGPRQIWCAAADYARRELGAGAAQRIYVENPRGPARGASSRIAVGFTLAPGPDLGEGPVNGQGGDWSVRVRDRGYNLSTSFAFGFCRDDMDPDSRPWLRP
ncbi:MAG: hypothetical protein ACLFQL_01950 [Paracoccaceae bacterium]